MRHRAVAGLATAALACAAVRFIAPRVFRPNDRSLMEVRRLAADAVAAAPDVRTATGDELLAIVHRDPGPPRPHGVRADQLEFAAGVGRAMLERLLTARAATGSSTG